MVAEFVSRKGEMFAGIEERLARNAAFVEADAAQTGAPFYHCDP
jgi:hypothetical protein